MSYEWDASKAAANLAKHGVGFEEATTVFEDVCALTYRDLDHTLVEARYLTVGMSATNRVLIVVTAERDERVRIISARKAISAERRDYESQFR